MMKRIFLGIIAALLVTGLVLYLGFPGVLHDLAMTLENKSAGLSEKSVVVDDHTISYLEGGEGEDVLLIHGFAANKENWTRFAKNLTPDFHVVAIDLPGFGQSTRLEEASYDYPSQVARLDRIVRALGLERFHVAGNSMGAAIAGKYAAAFPEKVRTVALFNAGGIPNCPSKSELNQRLEKGENPLLLEDGDDIDEFMAFVFVNPPWIPGPVKKHVAGQMRSRREHHARIFRDIHGEDHSLASDLPRIRARTLILWGDRDRLTDVSCTEVLEEGLPDSRTVIMRECGHAPMLERPGETADHYRRFLGEAEQD